MKRIFALILSAVLAFGGISASAEENQTDSLENTTKVSVKLTKPVPEGLGLDGELEKALSDFAVTLDAKLDVSGETETSLKSEIHTAITAGQEPKEAIVYFWTDYSKETNQLGFCIAGKADSDLKYGYLYIPSDIFTFIPVVQTAHRIRLLGTEDVRDSLVRMELEEKDGIYFAAVRSEDIQTALDQIDLNGIGDALKAEETVTKEQAELILKVIKALQNGMFAEEAARIELIPSADNTYLETVRLTFNFDMDAQTIAEIAGMENDALDMVSGALAFSVVIENTTSNLGNAPVTLPELTQDNTYWLGDAPIHAVYQNEMLMRYTNQPLLVQSASGGVTMVPAMEFLSASGIGADEVSYDAESGTLTVEPEWSGKKIEMTIGKQESFINGEAVSLLAAPTDTEGDVMVPLRFLAETLGLTVNYMPITDPLGYSVGGKVVVSGEVDRPLQSVTILAPDNLPEQILSFLEEGNGELLKVNAENYVQKSMLVIAAGEKYLLVDSGVFPEEQISDLIQQGAFRPLNDLLKVSEAFAGYLTQHPEVKEGITSGDGNIYCMPLEIEGEQYRIYVPATFQRFDKLAELADGWYTK
jgi:hypothetical protein